MIVFQRTDPNLLDIVLRVANNVFLPFFYILYVRFKTGSPLLTDYMRFGCRVKLRMEAKPDHFSHVEEGKRRGYTKKNTINF